MTRRAAHSRLILTLSVGSVFCPLLSRAANSTSERLNQSGTKLNEVYFDVLTAVPDLEAKAQLRVSQQAWVAYRGTGRVFVQQPGNRLGGTQKESYLPDINRTRTLQLEAIVNAAK